MMPREQVPRGGRAGLHHLTEDGKGQWDGVFFFTVSLGRQKGLMRAPSLGTLGTMKSGLQLKKKKSPLY